MSKPSLAFVGAGKVGTALARLLSTRGYTVETVYSRTFTHAAVLAQSVKAQAVTSLDAVRGDLVFLTVSDDAIRATAEALVGFKGSAAVHTSGAHDASELAVFAARGVQVGSLHPAYPFADVERALSGLPGATFALEADAEPLLGWLSELVMALEGQVLIIPTGSKALYHAALVLLSNYTVTLYALAERLLLELGAERTAVDAALNELVVGTVENLREQGIPNALTGPLVRGDARTVEAHINTLEAADPQVAELYRQLGRLSLPMLVERGLGTEQITELERLLTRDSTGT